MSDISLFKNVLRQEANAINIAADKIDAESVDRLGKIYESLLANGGHLVFVGVGKSGQIGAKLASTFSSLGLPSYLLHPVEALHGDLGRVSAADVFVLISKSGSTEEVIKLLPFISGEKRNLIGLLGNIDSPLAQKCGLVFDCSVPAEACLNNQAPTTSSTVTLAIGDAMAVVFEKISGLSREKFAVNHPGGLLGKSLLMRVQDLMWPIEKCSVVKESSTLKEAILSMTKDNLGGCAVVDKKANLLGIIVEGDIRRVLTDSNYDLDVKVLNVMTKSPVMIKSDDLALTALKLMEDRKRQISILPVVNSENIFEGFIRLHDLLKEGFSGK